MASTRTLSFRLPSRILVRALPASQNLLRPYVPIAQLGDWRGTRSEDQTTNRVKKGDVTDPQTEGTRSGQQEKEEKDGIKDRSKSQATTERDQNDSTRKAEEEFPKAPRPIIGMTDERGEVSNDRTTMPAAMFPEGGWLIFAFVSGTEGCVRLGCQEQDNEIWGVPQFS